MKTYICNKIITAVPVVMVNGIPWPNGLPLPEFGEQIQENDNGIVYNRPASIEHGYMFTASKGDKYPQYMVAEEFEKSCRIADNMNFGDALAALKQGKRVARKGWNGKNMSVAYQKGYPDGIPCNKNTAQAWGMEEGELFKCRPYLQMRCADGTFQMWLASQSDILADDWYIVE
jgi:hypothetical protein